MSINQRKICVVITNRSSYGRVKTVLHGIKDHARLDLQLILGAAMASDDTVKIAEADGFMPVRILNYLANGGDLQSQVQTTAQGMTALSKAFQELQPDFVMTIGDRHETMATAVTAAYLNIPLIHLQGGEVSGNIDDRVRHAVTKLADIHFACSAISGKRLIRMGEAEDRVFDTGCPSIDVTAMAEKSISNEIMRPYVDDAPHKIDFDKPYVLVLQHPVTTSYGDSRHQMEETLKSLLTLKDHQKIIMYSNVDAGSDEFAEAIRDFKAAGHDGSQGFYYYRHFPPEIFIRLMANAACCIGNSSAFLREASFMGVPAVIIGDRQVGREKNDNTVFVDYNAAEISDEIKAQINHGPYKPDERYGVGRAGQSIADIIAQLSDITPNKPTLYPDMDN